MAKARTKTRKTPTKKRTAIARVAAAPAAPRRRRRSAIARVATLATRPGGRRRIRRYTTEKTSDILMSEGTSLFFHFLGNEADMRLPRPYGARPTWIGAVVTFLGAVFVPKTWWRGKVKHLSRKALDGLLHSILGEKLHERQIEAGSSPTGV
jgi:hypothetical protein